MSSVVVLKLSGDEVCVFEHTGVTDTEKSIRIETEINGEREREKG